MAKITGPMLSFGGSGSLGKTIVYSKWRGVQYTRQYVIPGNPNTAGQQATRNVFASMSTMWKIMGPIAIAPWNTFATGRPFLGRNAYIGQNVKTMRGDLDMDNFVGSPGARGGLPADTVVITPGSGQLSVVVTAPTPPTGWTLTAAQAITFEDQDPALAFVSDITEGEDLTDPFDVVLTGLPNTVHQVSTWLKWLKADLSIAYSAADQQQATPAA